MLILLYYELGIDVVNRKLSESFSNQGGASSIDLYVSSSFNISRDTASYYSYLLSSVLGERSRTLPLLVE